MVDDGGTVTTERIRAALESVIDPCSVGQGRPMSVNAMGLVRGIAVEGGTVTVQLYLTSPVCTMIGKFQEMAEAALLPLPGVDSVRVEGDDGLQWPGVPGRRRALTGISAAARWRAPGR
jgi:metal-sulfur cluster biosynthetic enzyme